jgi:hypothetical protein
MNTKIVDNSEKIEVDTFIYETPQINNSNIWNIESPNLEGGYICRMDNSFIKMCFWDGTKWKDMWKETLDGIVRVWMNIPNENAKSIDNVKDAVSVLCNGLKEDSGLYIAYQANIAMAFKDEFDQQHSKRIPEFSKWLFTENGVHEIANNASTHFLKLLMS